MTRSNSAFISGVLALFACSAIFAACPAAKTCVAWPGITQYTDGTQIAPTRDITYSVLNGAKGGPYSSIAQKVGKPGVSQNIELPRVVNPSLCFVLTATAESPDKSTPPKLSVLTSEQSAEVCATAAPPPPPAPPPRAPVPRIVPR